MIDKDDSIYLDEIIGCCKRIKETLFKVDVDRFLDDFDLQDIVLWNIVKLGETAGALSSEFIEKYNKIDLKNAIAFRHKVAHGYRSIDMRLVYKIAKNDILKMLDELNNI